MAERKERGEGGGSEKGREGGKDGGKEEERMNTTYIEANRN